MNGNVSIFDRSSFAEVLNSFGQKTQMKYNQRNWLSFSDNKPVSVCTVGSLLDAVLSGVIVPYTNNRGTGTVSKDTFRNVSGDFDKDYIGQIIIGPYKGRLSIADGNSRVAGLVERFASGLMTEDELEAKVSVQYVDEDSFLPTYQNKNMTRPHSGIEKIKNPDYFFGKVFEKLQSHLGDDWDYLGGGSKVCQQAAYLVIWFYDNKANGYENLSYDNIFATRRIVKELELTFPSQAAYKLSQIPFDDICDGFEFYVNLRKEIAQIVAKSNLDKKAVKKICGSGPFMSLIVAEIASGRNSFGTSYIRLAKRIVANSSDLSSLSCCLTHSGSISTNETEIKIRKILTP